MAGPPPDEYRCKGTSKRTKKRCGKWKMRGKDYCDIHGGKSKEGSQLPQYKHGLYSKHAPTRMLANMDAFTDALESGQYLVLDEDISLANALVCEALEAVDTGGSKRRTQEIRRAWREFREASAAGDEDGAKKHAAALDRLIAEEASVFAALDEVHKWQRQKVHIVEAERKRIKDGQEMLSQLEAMAFMSNVLQAVRRHVKDPDVLNEIANEVANAGRAYKG